MSQPASLVYGALVLVTVGCGSVGEAVEARQAVTGGWDGVFVQGQSGL